MTAPRWDSYRLPAVARDLFCIAAGLRWGDHLIHQPVGQTEPWAWILVAGCLGFPVMTWADRLRLRRDEEPPSLNGVDPAQRERSGA